MINFKNSLKKTLAGAFGVITMLSPLQSAQCVNYYTYEDVARDYNLDIKTLPEDEIADLKDKAEKYNQHLDDIIESGIEACRTLILDPDNQDNKNKLNEIRIALNDAELCRLMLGEAISSIICDELYTTSLLTFNSYVYGTSYNTEVREGLDKSAQNIKRLTDFINKTINNYSSWARYHIFFNKYAIDGPLNLVRPLNLLYHRCRNNTISGPLVKNLFELIKDIYEECGETKEMDSVDLPDKYRQCF